MIPKLLLSLGYIKVKESIQGKNILFQQKQVYKLEQVWGTFDLPDVAEVQLPSAPRSIASDHFASPDYKHLMAPVFLYQTKHCKSHHLVRLYLLFFLFPFTLLNYQQSHGPQCPKIYWCIIVGKVHALLLGDQRVNSCRWDHLSSRGSLRRKKPQQLFVYMIR